MILCAYMPNNMFQCVVKTRARQFQIWHTAITHLDTLTIAFESTEPASPFRVFYEAPPNSPLMIVTEAQVDHYVFQFPELGVYGEGTLNCQFVIRTRTYTDHPSIHVTTHITFHEISFPSFTQYSAQGVIEVP